MVIVLAFRDLEGFRWLERPARPTPGPTWRNPPLSSAILFDFLCKLALTQTTEAANPFQGYSLGCFLHDFAMCPIPN